MKGVLKSLQGSLCGTLGSFPRGVERGESKTLSVSVTIMMLFAALSLGGMIFSDQASAFTTHAPILIEGDGGFTNASGVIWGSGTLADPYIIGGWQINTSTANGIEIRNTTAYFVIRDSYIYCGVTPFAYDGVVLTNVTYGRVTNVTFEDYIIYAFSAQYSGNISFTDNVFQRNVSGSYVPLYGVKIESVVNADVLDNEFTYTASCISVITSNNISIRGNEIQNCGSGVINSGSSNNVTVSDNNLSDIVSSYGIGIWSASNFTISRNNVSDANNVAIGIYMTCSNTTVSRNNVSDSKYSIYTQLARDLNISHNNVSNPTDIGIQIDRTVNVTCIGNSMTACGLSIMGLNQQHFDTHTIPLDNTANGKPIYYCNGVSGIAIDATPYSEVIVVNSTGVSIANLTTDSVDYGLEVAYADGIYVRDCSVTNVTMYNAYVYRTDNITLTNLNLTGGVMGLFQRLSQNFTLSDSIVANQSMRGVEVGYLTDANIIRNRISNSTWEGLYWVGTFSNVNSVVSYNEFRDNLRGVYLSDCPGLLLHHNNFINNTYQALDNLGTENKWNLTYPGGGNYWDNYTGVDLNSGPNQDIPGADGIGDTPFIIDANSIDSYPLMQSVILNSPPSASFDVTPSIGNTSTTFEFNASTCSDDHDPLSSLRVRWDWTNDGTWDTTWSTDKTEQHQYASQGVYTVRMEVNDSQGLTNYTTRQVTVDDDPPSTIVTLTGTAGAGGWYRTNVSVQLTSSDLLSGVQSIMYRTDAGSWTTYSGSFVISADGNHTLEFYSIDNASNAEAIQSVYASIDKVPGTLEAVYPLDGQIVRNATPVFAFFFDDSAGYSGVYNGSISILLDSSPVSDIPTVQNGMIMLQCSSPLSEGWHQLFVYVEDMAGNPATLGLSFFVNTTTLFDNVSQMLNYSLSELYDLINETTEALSALMDLLTLQVEGMGDEITALQEEINRLQLELSLYNQTLEQLQQELNQTTEDIDQIGSGQDDLSSGLSGLGEALLIALICMFAALIATVIVIYMLLNMRMNRLEGTRKDEGPPPPDM